MELQRIYKSSFEAGHLIEGHPKCGVQHGHSYNLQVSLNGDAAVWVDFADIKQQVDDFVQKKYDHQFLGSKTAEQIAQEIASFLEGRDYTGVLELFETSKFGVKVFFGKSGY